MAQQYHCHCSLAQDIPGADSSMSSRRGDGVLAAPHPSLHVEVVAGRRSTILTFPIPEAASRLPFSMRSKSRCDLSRQGGRSEYLRRLRVLRCQIEHLINPPLASLMGMVDPSRNSQILSLFCSPSACSLLGTRFHLESPSTPSFEIGRPS